MVIPFRHPQGQALQAIILPAEKEFRKDVLQIGVCNAFFFAKLKRHVASASENLYRISME